MKRTLSVILAIALMLPTIFCVTASAASYPSISASKYIEFKAQQDIKVYKDKACKTRGTSSPAKAYNAFISKNDVCYIYEIAASYIKLNYPTTSGRKTGFIKRGDLFDKTAPEEYVSSAKASVTVYKAQGTSGIAKGDKVWRVDPEVGYEGYRAVIYEAKSGKRAYKMGYIKLDDLDAIRNGVKNTKSTQTTKNTIIQTHQFPTTVTSSMTEVPSEFLVATTKAEKKNAARVAMFNDCLDMYKDMLNGKKAAARSQLDVLNNVNLRKKIESVLGTTFAAVATWNPSAMSGVVGVGDLIGLGAMVISEDTYIMAEKAHKKFLTYTGSKVKTAARADEAFELYVQALSGYNAVCAANLETVKHYAQKGNFKQEMLEEFCAAAASAAIPGDEFVELLEAMETIDCLTNMEDILEGVENKWNGAAAMAETRANWYRVWNKLR